MLQDATYLCRNEACDRYAYAVDVRVIPGGLLEPHRDEEESCPDCGETGECLG